MTTEFQKQMSSEIKTEVMTVCKIVSEIKMSTKIQGERPEIPPFDGRNMGKSHFRRACGMGDAVIIF